MNRRDSLKALMTASATLITLPSWAMEWNKSDVSMHGTSFLAEEQALLASVVDTIIPAGNAIGALAVGVDKFLQKLFDDCYENDVQDNVKVQLAGLETSAQRQFSKSFTFCDQQQREELLLKLSASENKAESDFFTLIKSETIRGFNTSSEVMLNYLKYKTAPGHFYGCVDVKP